MELLIPNSCVRSAVSFNRRHTSPEPGDARINEMPHDNTVTQNTAMPFRAAVLYNTVSGKKKPQYSRHNFDKFRHSFVIFSTNHPKDSFY